MQKRRHLEGIVGNLKSKMIGVILSGCGGGFAHLHKKQYFCSPKNRERNKKRENNLLQ